MQERPRPKSPSLSVWSLPLLLREVNFPIHRSLQTTGPMKKRGYNSDLARPVFAVSEPGTYHDPARLTQTDLRLL